LLAYALSSSCDGNPAAPAAQQSRMRSTSQGAERMGLRIEVHLMEDTGR
jgi:hypothetical protein